MAKIQVFKQEKGKLLHVEAPGCTVNIRVGLHDADGRDVTSVEVLADGERFAGASWSVEVDPAEDRTFPTHNVTLRVCNNHKSKEA
jgi:hypothetical protein